MNKEAILARLCESSTWRGLINLIIGLSSLFGFTMEWMTAENVVYTVLTALILVGGVGTVFPDKVPLSLFAKKSSSEPDEHAPF